MHEHLAIGTHPCKRKITLTVPKETTSSSPVVPHAQDCSQGSNLNAETIRTSSPFVSSSPTLVYEDRSTRFLQILQTSTESSIPSYLPMPLTSLNSEVFQPHTNQQTCNTTTQSLLSCSIIEPVDNEETPTPSSLNKPPLDNASCRLTRPSTPKALLSISLDDDSNLPPMRRVAGEYEEPCDFCSLNGIACYKVVDPRVLACAYCQRKKRSCSLVKKAKIFRTSGSAFLDFSSPSAKQPLPYQRTKQSGDAIQPKTVSAPAVKQMNFDFNDKIIPSLQSQVPTDSSLNDEAARELNSVFQTVGTIERTLS